MKEVSGARRRNWAQELGAGEGRHHLAQPTLRRSPPYPLATPNLLQQDARPESTRPGDIVGAADNPQTDLPWVPVKLEPAHEDLPPAGPHEPHADFKVPEHSI